MHIKTLNFYKMMQLYPAIHLFSHILLVLCRNVNRLPPTAILGGLLIIVSFAMSRACVSVPSTPWVEPIIQWVSIGMSTGCGKSPLYKYLLSILQKTKKQCGLSEEATFEKIGAMAENYSIGIGKLFNWN